MVDTPSTTFNVGFLALITARISDIPLKVRGMLSKIVPNSGNPCPIPTSEGVGKLLCKLADAGKVVAQTVLKPSASGGLTNVS